jgi:putative resolvase
MQNRLIKIGEAAKLLGSSPAQLRNWEVTGDIVPARKTKGGTRYYDEAELLSFFKKKGETA